MSDNEDAMHAGQKLYRELLKKGLADGGDEDAWMGVFLKHFSRYDMDLSGRQAISQDLRAAKYAIEGIMRKADFVLESATRFEEKFSFAACEIAGASPRHPDRDDYEVIAMFKNSGDACQAVAMFELTNDHCSYVALDLRTHEYVESDSSTDAATGAPPAAATDVSPREIKIFANEVELGRPQTGTVVMVEGLRINRRTPGYSVGTHITIKEGDQISLDPVWSK